MLIHPSDQSRSVEKCCDSKTFISCTEVNLNFDDFDKMKKKITVAGISLEFSNEVPPMGYAYKNENGDEAVFSYNKKTHHLFGNINTGDGKFFEIESCQFSHVFREIDQDSLNVLREEFEDMDEVEQKFSMLGSDKTLTTNHTLDRTTIRIISLMFYYTKAFKDVTPDIEGEVNQALAITNKGFINSKIPVRVEKFCIEAATGSVYEKTKNLTGILDDLKMMKGSPYKTLSTADAAVLLHTTGGGQGTLARPLPTEPFAWINKNMIKKYVLGHELGHTFGCCHDIYEKKCKKPHKDNEGGLGHHIEKGKNNIGYSTIMTYEQKDKGYSGENKVNYFSNPDVILPLSRTPTGVAGVSDCASVITKNSVHMSKIGDESARPMCKLNNPIQILGKTYFYS